MKQYYRYKKEKFNEKYKSAVDTLTNIKTCIDMYSDRDNKITLRAMVGYFQDFSEYILDMCETYVVLNDGKINTTMSGPDIINESQTLGFFDEELCDLLIKIIKLRNRYTHDYYKRESSEEAIKEFCFTSIKELELFLDNSKDKVILMMIKK